MVERYVRDVEVAGSNPVTPIFLLGYRKPRYEASGLFLCAQIRKESVKRADCFVKKSKSVINDQKNRQNERK